MKSKSASIVGRLEAVAGLLVCTTTAERTVFPATSIVYGPTSAQKHTRVSV